MGTTIEKLTKVLETKESIRNAINSKGGTLTESNKFSDYITAINNLASGGGSVELLKKVIVKGDTPPVPNTGYIEKIFFNTKLTTDQVDSIIASANLNFIDRGSGMIFYPLLFTDTNCIIILDFSSALGTESGSLWAIGNIESENGLYYISPAVAEVLGGAAGWNESLFTSFDTGEATIGANLNETFDGMEVGLQNNLLTNLVSLAAFTHTEKTEIVKSLTNQYKLVEENIILDTEVSSSYSYDFVNSINEETKEITVIKNIEVDGQEGDIIERSLTTYTNNKIKQIGDYAFYKCQNLTHVSFPEVTDVGNSAFYYCNNLVEINIPKITNIGNYAFYSCSNLPEINLSKVTNIGEYAFVACSLVNIDLPKATNIGKYAFHNCSNLVNINTPNITSVPIGAFGGCESLINAVLPAVKLIDKEGFKGNYKLTEVFVPNATKIEGNAFNNCYSLVKIFISQRNKVCELATPSSGQVFENAYHFHGTQDNIYNPNGLKDGRIYVPALLLSRYKTTGNWKLFIPQIIGHENFEAGATLPDYTSTRFTKQTWYSDEKLTTPVTEVATSGTYYCTLEA